VAEPTALRGVLAAAIDSVGQGHCALVEVAARRFGRKLF
jgi:hypothetical protein